MRLKTKSGKDLHPIGIGTWTMGGIWDSDARCDKPVYGTEEKEIDAIRYSISKGQNHIDTAEMYGLGHTDEIVGEAIKELKREDLFLADKLWRTSLFPGKVRPAVETMLKRLKTDYIDLLYIHNSFPESQWLEAIPEINQIIDEGIVLNFGVSNFNISEMKAASKVSKNPIRANQVHFNLLNKQEATKTVREFCQKNAIEIVAYRPIEWNKVAENKRIKGIADKKGFTPAQVALAWLLKMSALPIPKATDKKHIDENLGSLAVKLSEEELEILEKA